ncbi:hypothetical protein VNO77_43657 [Canavalia gladiata]|uniref:Uncharacterized protein n=1 Tax=Canavalia gladiata TaxID=3824 RepID=A0AAN9PQ35_CANGL
MASLTKPNRKYSKHLSRRVLRSNRIGNLAFELEQSFRPKGSPIGLVFRKYPYNHTKVDRKERKLGARDAWVEANGNSILPAKLVLFVLA